MSGIPGSRRTGNGWPMACRKPTGRRTGSPARSGWSTRAGAVASSSPRERRAPGPNSGRPTEGGWPSCPTGRGPNPPARGPPVSRNSARWRKRRSGSSLPRVAKPSSSRAAKPKSGASAGRQRGTGSRSLRPLPHPRPSRNARRPSATTRWWTATSR